jgi:hypothetical protein
MLLLTNKCAEDFYQLFHELMGQGIGSFGYTRIFGLKSASNSIDIGPTPDITNLFAPMQK